MKLTSTPLSERKLRALSGVETRNTKDTFNGIFME
jgi:hypothetical protein